MGGTSSVQRKYSAKESNESKRKYSGRDGFDSKKYENDRNDSEDGNFRSMKYNYDRVGTKRNSVFGSSIRNLAVKQLFQTLKDENDRKNVCEATVEGTFEEPPGWTDEKCEVAEQATEKILPTYNSELLQTTISPKKKPTLKVQISGDDDSKRSNPPLSKKTPRGNAWKSASGFVHMGDYLINDKGINNKEDMFDSTAGIQISGRTDFAEIRALGHGVSGVVVEAVHIPTLTIVALKMVPINDSDQLQQIANEFSVLHKNLAELRLLNFSLELEDVNAALPGIEEGDARLAVSTKSSASVYSRCPQVLALYDAFIDPTTGLMNLVVEYMDGGSLQDVVDHGGCSDEAVIADITCQVLLGLSFLHENNAIHRDIKPGNILLNCDGAVKLADFGIAKVIDQINPNEMQNSFVGTKYYMAPERITNNKYSFPSDIWSVGMTILSIAKGKYPLCPDGKDLNYWDLLRYICDDEPPTPGPTFSDEFNDFIASCLKKNPAERLTVGQLLKHPFIKNFVISMTGMSCKNANIDDSFDNEEYENGNIGINSALSTISQSQPGLVAKLASKTVVDVKRNDDCKRGLSSKAISTVTDNGLVSEEEKADANSASINVTAVRLEHLRLILSKLNSKYETVEKIREKGKFIKDVSFRIGRESSGLSTIISDQKSYYRSVSALNVDSKVKIPSFSGIGSLHWRHLASQVHCPYEIALSTAKSTINPAYLDDSDS